MRKFFALLAVVLVMASTTTAFAKQAKLDMTLAPRSGDLMNDVPARAPDGYARADTLNWGYYTVIGGNNYAVLGDKWTWDHGSRSDPFEGWYAIDQTANPYDAFRQITAGTWAGHLNGVAAPIIEGSGSVWLGLFEDQAQGLCWSAGLGYGNKWCQRLTSPSYTWNGSGNVNLDFVYFNDSELNFDYTKVMLEVGGNKLVLNGDGFSDAIGTPPTGPWASYPRAITASDFGVPGPVAFNIVFEFTSDGGWSDEDGSWPTDYGPFGCDLIHVNGDLVGQPYTYTFESDLEGWVPARCPGIGSYFTIQPLSQYIILDPCTCALAGNVAAFHNGNFEHNTGQLVSAWSPPADRTNYQSYNKIMADYDFYAEMPQANGVFYRPGWSYYPYLCPSTGQYGWSNRRGQNVWHYAGDAPVCTGTRNVGTDWGIPADCQDVGFVYEVYASCDAFGIPSTQCQLPANFTPLIDNVRIRMTGVVNAPAAALDVGDKFIDGFPQSANLGVMSPGNAKVGRPVGTYDWNTQDPGPLGWRLGDSLVVAGPTVTPSTKWEAKLWFRLKREGPGQIHIPAYRAWKTKVADGRQIVGRDGQFTWGWMDSVEVGPVVAKNKFDSYFRESDDDYTPGPAPKPDINPLNKIIQDGILTPGSKVEYFLTTNYTCLPTTYFVLPDTAGRFYYEFEILPSYRTVSDPPAGQYKFPCILYVDPDRGIQTWIEGAMNIALNGHNVIGAMKDIPDPTKWDRYDYNDASSNFHAPLFRSSGTQANNGATVAELLGYRFIMIDGGDLTGGAFTIRDWEGYATWLNTSTCLGNVNKQGFWAGGDGMAEIMRTEYPAFLNDYLGAGSACLASWYNAADCGNNQDYCARLETVGGAFDCGLNTDLWGNWCPQQYQFNVLATQGTGQGNKSFRKIGGALTNYAQVVNDQLSPTYTNNYRSVLNGYSLLKMIERTGSDPTTECTFDTTKVLNATYCEFTALTKWILDLGTGFDLTTYGLCIDPCLDYSSAPDLSSGAAAMVNRLEQNSPNPFNPSTSIRFSLAQTGPAKVSIYDVSGRMVRALVDGPLSAGPHTAVWDGMDQSGHKVPAGIYWSQLSTSGYSSNKKMVVVR